MYKFRLFWAIVRRCHFEKLLIGFFLCFFVSALIIQGVEPAIDTYGEACWYTFASCTTIGFGDFVATTFVGRLFTILITIYEIVLAAVMSGVIVTLYMEVIQKREKETTTMFLDKLSHLSELNHEELIRIENKVKKFVK